MDTNTTRPVAVKAGTRHARRSHGVKGDPANGMKQNHHHSSVEGSVMDPATSKEPLQVGALLPCAVGDLIATEYGPGQVVSIATEEWRHSRKARARISVILPAQPEWGFDEEWNVDLLESFDRPDEWPDVIVSAADPSVVGDGWPLVPTPAEEQMLRELQQLVELP